jgi:hypothetical protein
LLSSQKQKHPTRKTKPQSYVTMMISTKSILSLMIATLLLVATQAKVLRRGRCPDGSKFKLAAYREDRGKLDIEFEVETNRQAKSTLLFEIRKDLHLTRRNQRRASRPMPIV